MPAVPPRRSVACVGALVYDDSHRLLVVRRRNPPAAGLWSIPGGRVEVGEDDVDAVRRETREETGLDVLVGARVGTVFRDGPGGVVYDIRDYACGVTRGQLQAGDDATDAVFVDRGTLLDLDAAGHVAGGLVESLRLWGALPR